MKHLKNDLLIAVLNHGQGEKFTSLAKAEGATGATIIPAKGTASSAILRLFGLDDTSKDVVYMVLEEKLANRVIEVVQENSKFVGVAALLAEGRGKMESKWKMITVIVNSGYADDIMDAARKAGATGGTVTHARGTASNDQESHFLGITIVPEKEMVMILTEAEKEEAIINAIHSLDCLQEEGVGIIFSQDVKDFKNLGKKN